MSTSFKNDVLQRLGSAMGSCEGLVRAFSVHFYSSHSLTAKFTTAGEFCKATRLRRTKRDALGFPAPMHIVMAGLRPGHLLIL